MNVTVIFAIVATIFCLTSLFLGKEMLKKFSFMRSFVKNSSLLVKYHYPGNKVAGHKPGMRKIAFLAKNNQQFSLLIGFELSLFASKGFDYYGFVSSNDKGILVIETYLGKSHVNFQFLKNEDVEISIIADESVQKMAPNASYPPHFWQKLGLWG
jgi:hypothetical protein